MLVGSARVSTLDQNPVLPISGLKATWCVSQLPAGKEANGDTAATEQIPQVSPVAWQHINFYGRYEFSKGPEPINVEAIVEVLAQHPLAAVEDET